MYSASTLAGSARQALLRGCTRRIGTELGAIVNEEAAGKQTKAYVDRSAERETKRTKSNFRRRRTRAGNDEGADGRRQ